MRTFVIGDVHGWAESLERLLERLRPRAATGDSLVFLGDYIDRGPESRRVVELVLAERDRWLGPVVTLKGNHEALLLEALEGDPQAVVRWLNAGQGMATIRSYAPEGGLAAFREALPQEHLAFLQGLALWHEDENGIYVHAGIVPGKRPDECSEEALLWIRERFIESEEDCGKPVVFGHTPQYESEFLRFAPEDSTAPGRQIALHQVVWRPLNRPEKIGLDTGRGWGGPLTAVILPEREFVSEA